MSFEFRRYFPYPTVRPEQDASIEFVLDTFLRQGKRFVVLELGTGCGKSAIGLTVSRYLDGIRVPSEEFLPGSYVLTTQKVLQEQYLHDFGPPAGELVSIKSSANFQCEFYPENTCGESRRLLDGKHKGSAFWNKCMVDCCYAKAKQQFMDSHESITNYSYFLSETRYGGKLLPRDLLILDEAHNCEAELSKFIEVIISEKFATQVLGLAWANHDTPKSVVNWIHDIYEPAVTKKLKHAKGLMEAMKMDRSNPAFRAQVTQIDMLDRHVCKLHRFLQLWDDENWVMNVVEPDSVQAMRKFEFKPVDVAPYVEDHLFRFGKRVLLMSATIVNRDVFCETLGIRLEDVAFLSIDSPFPIENRPIYYAPVGNMGMGTIEQTLPKLAEMVKLILDQHKGEKGIIHAHTFRIANYLKKHIKGKRGQRLLVHDSSNREEVVQEHMTSKDDTVLLSPSLSEGIDLKDDLSRFQIICKIPYPYLGDKLVRKRMNRHKLWYPFQTAKTIVQSAGRSIRNETDHAVTYILDGGWDGFFGKNTDMFPESFKRALRE